MSMSLDEVDLEAARDKNVLGENGVTHMHYRVRALRSASTAAVSLADDRSVYVVEHPDGAGTAW
jgi:hypothetical protein